MVHVPDAQGRLRKAQHGTMKTHNRGFTLLEVLVVLIITGMLTAVLTQALGFVLQIRLSVMNKITGLEKTAVTRSLYLSPLEGLVPDYPEKPDIFVGSENKIHGLTTHAIENRPGAIVPFEMYFDSDPNNSQTTLIYKERGREPLKLGSWPGNVGRFTYKDRTGPWLAAWPPAQAIGKERPSQTPWSVRIEMGTGFPSALVAYVAGPHDRISRLQDTFGGDLRLEDLTK